MASVPETADEKKAKLSDAMGARTAAGADFDGLMVLSLVSKIYKPVKELWSVNKVLLDPEVPRDVHISVEVPADVRTRLLHQHERKAMGQHYFPVDGVYLGGPRAWDTEDNDVNETITRDPSVAIALTMLPPSLKRLRFAPHYNLPIQFTPGSVIGKVKFGDEFDHEVDLSQIRGLKTVVFGECFNRPVQLPPGLRKVKFGHQFNQRVELPRGLVLAYFKDCFDQPLVLPDGLEELVMGTDFNQDLEFPSSLKYLCLICINSSRALNFPKGLEDLMLGGSFNRALTLPPSLRRLWFVPDSKFNQPLVGLPAGLEELSLGCMFNHPLPDLPAGLERLEFEDMAERFEGQPPSQYNSPITLPAGLKHAKFGYSFNQPVELNDGLEEVEFGHTFDQELTIPKGLKRLTVPLHYPHDKLIIPTEGGSKTSKRECSDKKIVYHFSSSECAV